MKNTLFLAGISLALSLFLLPTCTQSTVKSPVPGDASQPGYPNLPYIIMPDVQHDIRNVEVDPQILMDNLSWQTFIALCWPASTDPNQRGVPDLDNAIGGLNPGGFNPKNLPAGPTVWETFKQTEDLYLNPYKVPDTSFNAPPILPPQCASDKTAGLSFHPRVLTMISKFSDAISDSLQAFSNAPLIDQNGNTVWYEVVLNKSYFEYVVQNQFYNKNNQAGKTINFPAGNNQTTQLGAIRVKAAWKIFDWKKEGSRLKYFYTTKGYIFNTKSNVCDTATLALVGLHIAHKTKSRPEWVWSTFEHMYNCPDSTGWPALPSGWATYSFNNPAQKGPYNVPPKAGSTTPVQVLRLTPIPGQGAEDNLRQLNMSYQNLLRSYRSDNVWQYYMLVNTQWPSNPADTKDYGVPRPPYLANSVIETYYQGPSVNGQPPHSCMGCHGQYASAKDFDFQLFKAQSPSSASPKKTK
jgi:hypothetical protein